MRKELLRVQLSVDYRGKTGVLRDVAFEVHAGEIVGLVGQSGSGKSTIALSILQLLEYKGGKADGEIQFLGRDLSQLRSKEMRQIRGREIGLVLQSPLLALNPSLKIGALLSEAWRAHRREVRDWRGPALEALHMVSLPNAEELLDRYPRELSVGQAQRVVIAMAILHRPRLLIADEPTSALDAITQCEILELFRRLNATLDMAVLFISHDLPSVASLCSRVVILHQGAIVESGSTEQIFLHPRHSYTQALVNAVPRSPLMGAHGLAALARNVAREDAPEDHSASVAETSLSTFIE